MGMFASKSQKDGVNTLWANIHRNKLDTITYLNEWDCCSELGSDDEGDDDNNEDSLEEGTPFEDYDQISAEPLAPQNTSIGSHSHLDHIDDSEELPPICLCLKTPRFVLQLMGWRKRFLK